MFSSNYNQKLHLYKYLCTYFSQLAKDDSYKISKQIIFNRYTYME